ncbi:MAG TPA: type 4a pilus biogenesis protein PilO [Solimonas sp.]|nr:type 4a pilus biogenesis protein PilO [Solimonas sp.]
MNAQDILRDLQTLDAQNPGAWPLWVRIAATILLGVIILGAGGHFLVRPVYETLKQEEARELELRSKFERNQAKAAALDLYKEQLAEMERNFGAMLKQLPSKSEVANLLNDISQTRVSSSLEEELFQPEAEIPKEFYAEIPNKIIVNGTFHEMGSYVSAIAALPRIVTIDEVDIGTGKKNAKDTKPGEGLRMQAKAKTYRYLDEDEAAAESAKKSPAKAKGAGK